MSRPMCEVRLLPPGTIPGGQHWCVVQLPTGRQIAYFHEDQFSPDLVARAWSAMTSRPHHDLLVAGSD